MTPRETLSRASGAEPGMWGELSQSTLLFTSPFFAGKSEQRAASVSRLPQEGRFQIRIICVICIMVEHISKES